MDSDVRLDLACSLAEIMEDYYVLLEGDVLVKEGDKWTPITLRDDRWSELIEASPHDVTIKDIKPIDRNQEDCILVEVKNGDTYMINDVSEDDLYSYYQDSYYQDY